MNDSDDKLLRSQVKLFGSILGNVLKKQAGEQVYSAVETLRTGFIELRQQDDPAKREYLSSVIANLSPSTLTYVVRAFSLYFSLVNIAEETHHHSLRRNIVANDQPFWRGSFNHSFIELKSQGVSADEAQKLVDEMSYTPVFTDRKSVV